ncbi:hypothetical protein Tco_0556613 [Tanacetum coccineum]
MDGRANRSEAPHSGPSYYDVVRSFATSLSPYHVYDFYIVPCLTPTLVVVLANVLHQDLFWSLDMWGESIFSRIRNVYPDIGECDRVGIVGCKKRCSHLMVTDLFWLGRGSRVRLSERSLVPGRVTDTSCALTAQQCGLLTRCNIAIPRARREEEEEEKQIGKRRKKRKARDKRYQKEERRKKERKKKEKKREKQKKDRRQRQDETKDNFGTNCQRLNEEGRAILEFCHRSRPSCSELFLQEEGRSLNYLPELWREDLSYVAMNSCGNTLAHTSKLWKGKPPLVWLVIFSSAKMPEEWRLSEVIPIYKNTRATCRLCWPPHRSIKPLCHTMTALGEEEYS